MSLPSAEAAAVAVTPPPLPGMQAGQSASVVHEIEFSSQHWLVRQTPGWRNVGGQSAFVVQVVSGLLSQLPTRQGEPGVAQSEFELHSSFVSSKQTRSGTVYWRHSSWPSSRSKATSVP